MDGSRDYDLTIRQQPKQARMCGVGGMSLPMVFFLFSFFFSIFYIFFPTPWNGVAHSLQLIDDQSTLRPLYNCASPTKLVKTSHRPHRPLPLSTINSLPPTHMHNNTPTTLPAPWILPCSPQPALEQVHSSRTRITLCLPVSPSPTTTPSCTG